MQPFVAQNHDTGRDLVKWLALITMTIDHVGMILYPQILVLRYIGRLSFPLFAYLIALGVSSTHDLGKYLKRMFGFALISQLPFTVANGIPIGQKLNIFFTLSLGIILIYYQDKKNILMVAPLIASIFLPIEYGSYGLATILFLNIIRRNKLTGAFLLITLNLLLIPYGIGYQLLSLFSLPIILLHSSGKLKDTHLKIKVPHSFISKYFFYAYYPSHLMFLTLIKQIV